MPVPHGFIEKLAELSRSGVPFACVTLVEAIGSTPQDAGSKILVDASGLVLGTVGGGRIEQQAIGHAQTLLQQGTSQACPVQLLEWNLQRDVGMTCGGVVKVYFEVYNLTDWRIALFGAGHVAQAVVHCLQPLACHVTWIDPRADWLGRIPADDQLTKIETDRPQDSVVQLPDDTYVLCMTMGHRTDRPILEALFRQRRPYPYVGVIGSKAKRAVLSRELRAAGISSQQIDTLHCPIGIPLGTNQPGEIAISIVAQLIEVRDTWRKVSSSGA
jgi:xanthine dehydrogenase accessory factor